jgi:hypothetical protein
MPAVGPWAYSANTVTENGNLYSTGYTHFPNISFAALFMLLAFIFHL